MGADSDAGGGAAPPEKGDDRPNRKHVRIQMAAIGLEFSSSVLGGLFMGYYLDEWLGTEPWLFLLLTFGGLGVAVMRMIQLIERFQRSRES